MDFFYYDFISNLYCKIAFFGLLRPVAFWSRIPGAGDQDSGSGFRSGATVVFAPWERLDYAPARVPQCFSYYENVWIARPLGCHSGFPTRRAAGLGARSGATVFFSLRERMDRSSARVRQWFPHPERCWITRLLGGEVGRSEAGRAWW